jgi:predicted nucleotidyltransferase
MTREVRSLLTELKRGLEEVYGSRLRGVYLFGSYARDEEDTESDLDVLIVLDSFDHYAAEVERTGFLVSGLSLHYGVSISRVLISQADWAQRRTPFLAALAGEAVAV